MHLSITDLRGGISTRHCDFEAVPKPIKVIRGTG